MLDYSHIPLSPCLPWVFIHPFMNPYYQPKKWYASILRLFVYIMCLFLKNWQIIIRFLKLHTYRYQHQLKIFSVLSYYFIVILCFCFSWLVTYFNNCCMKKVVIVVNSIVHLHYITKADLCSIMCWTVLNIKKTITVQCVKYPWN